MWLSCAILCWSGCGPADWPYLKGGLILAAAQVKPEQCKDPLYQTHWAGKNDIQTLLEYPSVRTNLKLCPVYNQRASCCHSTFESEQQKYYGFAIARIQKQFARADLHRKAVAAAYAAKIYAAPAKDLEQAQVALSRYEALLAPSVEQKTCFTQLLTYTAGMVCFCCKPEWTRFVSLSDVPEAAQVAPPENQRVARVRMARTVCNTLWASCQSFGQLVTSLAAALRDSSIARQVSVSQESFAMFTAQEALCDWMHDEFALSPFRLPAKEMGDLPAMGVGGVQALFDARSLRAALNATARLVELPVRRLDVEQQELDVLLEGQQSTFVRVWQGTNPASAANQRTHMVFAILMTVGSQLVA